MRVELKKQIMHPFEIEKHRLDRYRLFSDAYDLKESDFSTLVDLYDIDELLSFMPPKPTSNEKAVFQELIGVTGVSGYIDYRKSNNTFELIMQWRERTNNLDGYGFKIKSE